MNMYDESRFKDFLCPKDGELWKLVMKSIEGSRSYVINYNLGRDLVKEYVERRAGPGATPERRWYAEELFARLAVLDVTGDREVIGWNAERG